MPLDNLPYAEQMEKYGFIAADHAAPKFFPVKARKLFDETGKELPGYLRIVREDTEETLHVASDEYKVVTNEEAFGAFEEALANSTLDRTDMRIGTDYAGRGRRCFRQYLLPAHRVEVRPGVEVALRLVMMNSYDGSLKFRGQCGAYNFVCANTSISGKDYAQFNMRHSGKVDVKEAIKGLTLAAEDHINLTKRWKVWPGIPVSDQQALLVCKDMPTATEGLVDNLVHSWLKARDADGPQSGANLWTLFNVMTAWATHADGSNVVKLGRGQAKFDREKRVARLLDISPTWKLLEAEGV